MGPCPPIMQRLLSALLILSGITVTPVSSQDGCVLDTIAQPPVETSLLSTFGHGLARANGYLFASSPSETNRLFSFGGGVGNWQLLETIQGPPSAFLPSNLNFGATLAFRGGRLAAGAPYSSLLGAPNGVAFIYELNPATNVLLPIALLAPPFGSTARRFGTSVAIDTSTPDTYYYVGAPGDAGFEGEIFVYEVGFVGYSLVSAFMASDQTPQQRFGTSLAALDGRLAVGAPGPSTTTGSVYLYELNAGGFPETQRVLPSTFDPGQNFGEAIALDGDRLLVGAPADFVGTGVGYVFERNLLGQYVEIGRLEPELPLGLDASQFGTRVALLGDLAVLRGRTSAAQGLRPVIVVFERRGNQWFQHKLITAADLGFDAVDNLIGDVLVRDDRVIFATKDVAAQERRIVEYRLPGEIVELGPGLAGLAAPELEIDGCLASDTQITTRVVAGRPNAAGVLAIGQTAVDIPFQGGRIYVGPTYLVFELHTLDFLGNYEFSVPLSSATAGRHFSVQAAYFDSFAPAGLSFTNGLDLVIE